MTSCSFLTYATGSFVPAARALCASALAVGFDRARVLGPEALEPAFRQNNAAILSEPRGAGYWLWKPQIILQELNRLAPGEVLVYSDAGRSPLLPAPPFSHAAGCQGAGARLPARPGHPTTRGDELLVQARRLHPHRHGPAGDCGAATHSGHLEPVDQLPSGSALSFTLARREP